MHLLNDDSNPDRGALNHAEFRRAWQQALLRLDRNEGTFDQLSCERLAAYHIVTAETSGSYAVSISCAPPDHTRTLQLQYRSHQTGAGADR